MNDHELISAAGSGLIWNSLRPLCVLCASAWVFSNLIHRRDAEVAENTQRKAEIGAPLGRELFADPAFASLREMTIRLGPFTQRCKARKEKSLSKDTTLPGH